MTQLIHCCYCCYYSWGWFAEIIASMDTKLGFKLWDFVSVCSYWYVFELEYDQLKWWGILGGNKWNMKFIEIAFVVGLE